MSQPPWTPPPHPQGPYRPPPPTSTNAVAALALGVISILLCCGPLTAVPAIILGRNALREIDAEPVQYQGRGLAIAGCVLGIIGIVVFLIAAAAVLVLYLTLDCSILDGDAFTSSSCG